MGIEEPSDKYAGPRKTTMTTTTASQHHLRQVFKELEALRNNLAHSQDIITCDWDIIVKLTEYMERRLGSSA